MVKLISIGMGGFLGAILRYWVSGWAYRVWQTDFPVGTFLVNILGSFCLGLVMGFTEEHIVNPEVRLFLTIGLLGAFTTFSTFSYETVMLLQVGALGKAVINIIVSVFFGLLAAWMGLVVGRLV